MATCRTTVSTSPPQAPAPADPTHTTMGFISALPENLLREVFSRVRSVPSLFMLAVTCRRWLRRFTDPAFLREMLCAGQLQEGDPRARLLGIFLQDTGFDRLDGAMVHARMAQRASAFAPTFLAAPGSPLGLPGSLASLVADDDGTFNYAEPLAARRGIVLMRLAPRTHAETNRHLFGICNPVTGGDRHVLPPLEVSSADYEDCVRGYAIVTAADSDLDGTTSAEARFTFSQLLVITKSDWGTYRDHHYLHSCSAATRRWSTHTRCLEAYRYSLVGERSAVVHQGAAHWLCIDDFGQVRRGDAATCENRLYKLSVEVATGDISLTKLPVRGGGKPLLCVTRDGKLAVASVYHAHVTVWTQPAGAEDGGGAAAAAAAWPKTSFRIPPAVQPDVPPKWQSEEWYSFGQGSILVIYSSGDVFILDLHTEVMEKAGKVMNSEPSPWFGVNGDRNRKRVASIAYEMDLVEFFTRQLHFGGLGRDGNGPEWQPSSKVEFLLKINHGLIDEDELAGFNLS